MTKQHREGVQRPALIADDSAGLAKTIDEQIAAREGAPTTHPQFDRLVRMIWRLRQPDGCPWDKVQTHHSITRNMIEEAYEAVQCIEDDDELHLREELGDVLEQVLLHAQIAADGGMSGGHGGLFDIDDVCRELNEKLIRRHPHVFGDAAALGAVDSAGKVLDIWDRVKQDERAAAREADAKQGLLDSVPMSLPALAQAQKISKRAAKAGFEWNDLAGVWNKVAEERAEFEAEEQGSDAAAEEFGDLLFALVNVARWQGIDAESALATSNRKFRRRWACMEELATANDKDISELSAAQLEDLWLQSKQEERT
ncbi:nucleoside triphosphate pyrophosphohydrolase [uncultured Olegusella sp.]|uniref:nucleoside triphosphate pyrophosphohydrolase n=1 Tax=uncultured Olegusella sp. TaxID=1979846 RepID=UPI00261FC8E8|nr:nucleoside triphosphate pyrophosphohydrolase [uncultured Olegusella sp.]